MLSISNVGAEQAGSYYDKDGYYVRMGDQDNSWYGTLKEELQLPDAITKEAFNRLVNERKERAGFDLCFSAPKSISIAMCMDDQTRADMLESHNKAVESILLQIEQKEIGARITNNKVTEHVKTGNMICGRFNHYVSRASDPQLHTHCVILNKTKHNDKYYAVDNPSLYENKIYYGQLYRNTLAKELMQKGYEVEVTNREKGFFELTGISQKSMEHFSSRRAEIVQQLKDWDTSSAQLAEKAALLTRHAKENRDISVLMNSWKETLTEMGVNPIDKAPEAIVPSQEQLKEEFDRAVNHISHRHFAFKERDMDKVALAHGVGLGMTEDQMKELFKQEIGKKILSLGKRLENANKLKKDPNVYFCTQKNYEIERELFQKVNQARDKIKIQVDKVDKVEKFLDQNAKDLLSNQQRNAVIFVTTNEDQYIAVQGLAGTGKTHMLNHARQVFEANGYEVKGACYTGKAANGLENDAKIPSKTIHGFLNQLEKEAGNSDSNQDFKNKHDWKLEGLKPGSKKEIWIVDEASMVGNTTMLNLMKAAEAKKAKVVFVGDRQQLLPVAVGNAFSKMVENNTINSIRMTEIQRQKDKELLASVKEAVLGDVSKSFQIINKNVQVIDKRKDRMKAIVREFAMLNKDERNKTVILTADNKDRKMLNANVRKVLKNSGELLSGQYIEVLDGRGATSKKEFSIDDKIIFLQNDNRIGVRNGQTGFVKEIRENSLIINSEGKNVDIDLSQYNKIDHGYVLTTHKAQGITEDRAIINLDSEQKQLNSRNSYYVDISRARFEVKLFTNNQKKIEAQVEEFAKKLTSDDFLISKVPQNRPEDMTTFKNTLDDLQKSVIQLQTQKKSLERLPDKNIKGGGPLKKSENKSKGSQFTIN